MAHDAFSYQPYFGDAETLFPTSGCSHQEPEQPLKFVGDFYAETDDITRGMYMPTATTDSPLLGGGFEPKGSGLDAEADYVAHGVYMPSAPPDSSLLGGGEDSGLDAGLLDDDVTRGACMPTAPFDLSFLGGAFEGKGLDAELDNFAHIPLAPPNLLFGGSLEHAGRSSDVELEDSPACGRYMPTAPLDFPSLGGGFEQKGAFGTELAGAARDMGMLAAAPELSFLGGRCMDAGFSNCRDIDFPDLACQGSVGTFHCLNGVPGSLNRHDLHGGAAKDDNAASCQPAIPRRFVETDCPPLLPKEPFFQLAATTLQVRGIAPYEIGNLVLDFLAAQLKSSVRKVSFVKFAVKAEVFVDGVSCVLKSRTYSGEWGIHSLEFQRRSGDCMAFGRAFRLAADYFSLHLVASPEHPLEVPKACTPGGGELGIAGVEGIQPLLDIAKPKSTAPLPALQAEAAASISNLASDDQEASSLCNSRAFDGVKQLMHSGQDSIAYPAACTLSALAGRPEAAPYFVDRGILPVVADKIRSKATSTIVHRELVKALSTITAMLPEEVSNEIMESLADMPIFTDALTQQQVQKASSAVEYRHTGAPGAPSGDAAAVQFGGAGKLPGGSCALPPDALAPRAR